MKIIKTNQRIRLERNWKYERERERERGSFIPLIVDIEKGKNCNSEANFPLTTSKAGRL